jgi:hypothetical protein
MAIRSTAAQRHALMGVAVAGALAGATGTASAQYYLYDDAPYIEQRFGYGYRYLAPRPPAPIPQRAIGRIAARDYGLTRVDRTIATGSAYVVDGRTRSGARVRLILDPYSGQVLDEIVLQAPPRTAPRVARTDPRDEARPRAQRLAPQPPERPAPPKPPGQATAPATVIPPSPAAPPKAETPKAEPGPTQERKAPAEASAPATQTPPAPAAPPRAEPAPPPEKPPAEAAAPATDTPPAPAAPAAPTPGAADPATGAEKPRLVNPTDVRGSEAGERTPPLARSENPGIPAQLPPVQPQDTTTAQPRPETPAVPVVPMD